MKFSVEPRLLDHFGIAMYNTVPKAIAELCANAYDADASKVEVSYGDDGIAIVDDGTGMSESQVEDDYLRLGRDRREGRGSSRQKTKSGRAVIGNKGIGKLAGFGIAQTMTVRTWCRDKETTIVLDREQMESATDLESFEIKPKQGKAKRGSHGTEILLAHLLEDITIPDAEKLRSYLARHLPARDGWTIFVNGVEATAADIPGKSFKFSDRIRGFGKVTGFYVVADDRRGLTPGFAVRVRDRIVQENSLFGLTQQSHGFFNVARIVGELQPDFLDPAEGSASRREQFVINTSRSGFNPEDPGVQALAEYARKKMEKIAEGLAKERSKEKKQAALDRHPEVQKRIKALGPEVYAKLNETLDSVISKLSRNETDETVDSVVDLIIGYYESDALRVILETIKESSPEEVERLSRLLAEYGAARVGDVAGTLHTQIEVIELLREKVADRVIESEIHEIVAQNIWLFRDGLTYWFDNKQFATKLGNSLAKKYKRFAKQRPDLVCFDDRSLQAKQGMPPTKLLVIEFKRPGVEIGSTELTQVMNYKSIFASSLAGIEPDQIEVVVLGDKFKAGFDRAALVGYTLKSYEELLQEAADRYRDLYRSLVPEGFPVDQAAGG
jgi:hypothetical protein